MWSACSPTLEAALAFGGRRSTPRLLPVENEPVHSSATSC